MDSMQERREKRSRMKVILMIAGIVVVLALAGAGVWFALSGLKGSGTVSRRNRRKPL